MLTPSLDVVRSRDAGRDKHVFELWQHLEHELRTRLPPVGLWLDTSELTVEEILARAGETLVDPPAG